VKVLQEYHGIPQRNSENTTSGGFST